jgi:HAD superfamily hydrolase (TIGR01484 family)
MGTALLFDIDGTLTTPRQPIAKSMFNEVLGRLKIPFHVAAGSHIDLLQNQFFDPLYDFGFRGQFEAFVSNGAIHYHCDYSKDKSIREISKFDIRNHLGETDYNFLIETLKKTLQMPEFKLGEELKILGETVTFRVSMVNFVPIGRVEEENNPKIIANRERFVKFDNKNGPNEFRRKVLRHLENELASLIENKDLRITLGGQTSFDIGVLGQDKTKAVRTLLDMGVDWLVFIGDALFPGGNDAAIREYIEDYMHRHPSSKAEWEEVRPTYKKNEDEKIKLIKLINELKRILSKLDFIEK